MPNGIKYSTSPQTRALKKGNFWFSTDESKGPTSSSDYWNGITPPASGYTIYQSRVSGGPSIYVANNVSELIYLTNHIAGTNYTTSGECLNYFATQTDKVIFNRDYEGINTNSLVFNLDAGFVPSYPTTGTTWYDLSLSGYNGTLINGPTFSPLSGGSIVMDGTDDYVSVTTGTGINIGVNFTLQTWARISRFGGGTSPGRFNRASLITNSDTYSSNNGFSFMATSQGPPPNFTPTPGGEFFFLGMGADQYASATPAGSLSGAVNNWVNLAATVNGTNPIRLFIDGAEAPYSSQGNGPSSWSYGTGGFFVGARGISVNPEYLQGSISNAMMYNRALSSSEIFQNYIALYPRMMGIVSDGLVLNLDAASLGSYPKSGTTWYDLSGQGNNGTLTNGPTFNPLSGNSIVFDGSDDFVNLGNPSSLSISNLTICAWVRTTRTSNQIIVGKSYTSSYYLNFAPFANNISFWTNNSELADYSVTTLGNGNWFFVCATINGNNKAIYHNGTLKTSGTGTAPAIDSNPVYIGNSPTNNAYFQGNMGLVQIYNRALSATEILQNYNATKGRFGL